MNKALKSIFSNSSKRSDYISDLDFNYVRGERVFFKDFINTHSNSNSISMLTDLLELSIKINYFSQKLYDSAWDQFFSKRFDYRLSFVDYNFRFFKRIPRRNYVEVNREIKEKSRNAGIKYQAIVNLLMVQKGDISELLKLLEMWKDRKQSYFIYYRAVRIVEEDLDKNGILKKKLTGLLSSKMDSLSNSQRQELLSRM